MTRAPARSNAGGILLRLPSPTRRMSPEDHKKAFLRDLWLEYYLTIRKPTVPTRAYDWSKGLH